MIDGSLDENSVHASSNDGHTGAKMPAQGTSSASTKLPSYTASPISVLKRPRFVVDPAQDTAEDHERSSQSTISLPSFKKRYRKKVAFSDTNKQGIQVRHSILSPLVESLHFLQSVALRIEDTKRSSDQPRVLKNDPICLIFGTTELEKGFTVLQSAKDVTITYSRNESVPCGNLSFSDSCSNTENADDGASTVRNEAESVWDDDATTVAASEGVKSAGNKEDASMKVSIDRVGRFSTELVLTLESYDYDYLELFIKTFCPRNSLKMVVPRELTNHIKCYPQLIQKSAVWHKVLPLPISTSIPGRKLQICTNSSTDLVMEMIKIKKLGDDYPLPGSKTIAPDPEKSYVSTTFQAHYTFPVFSMDDLPTTQTYNESVLSSKGVSSYKTETNSIETSGPQPDNPSSLSQQFFRILQLTKREVTFLIGKKGAKIEKLRSQTHCNIKVIPFNEAHNQTLPNANANYGVQFIRVVSNDKESFEACLQMIENELMIFRCNNDRF